MEVLFFFKKRSHAQTKKEVMSACAASHLRVDDFVSAQRAGLPKSFPTDFTHEGPGPGVHRHVPGQIVMRVKNLWRIQKYRGFYCE